MTADKHVDSLYSIIAVVLVLALLGGTLALLRNRGHAVLNFSARASRTKQMEVTERLALGPQHALHLVRIGNRSVVVATSPSSCRLLDVVPEGRVSE